MGRGLRRALAVPPPPCRPRRRLRRFFGRLRRPPPEDVGPPTSGAERSGTRSSAPSQPQVRPRGRSEDVSMRCLPISSGRLWRRRSRIWGRPCRRHGVAGLPSGHGLDRSSEFVGLYATMDGGAWSTSVRQQLTCFLLMALETTPFVRTRSPHHPRKGQLKLMGWPHLTAPCEGRRSRRLCVACEPLGGIARDHSNRPRGRALI